MEDEQFKLYEVGIMVIFMMQRLKHPIFAFLTQLRTSKGCKVKEDIKNKMIAMPSENICTQRKLTHTRTLRTPHSLQTLIKLSSFSSHGRLCQLSPQTNIYTHKYSEDWPNKNHLRIGGIWYIQNHRPTKYDQVKDDNQGQSSSPLTKLLTRSLKKNLYDRING